MAKIRITDLASTSSLSPTDVLPSVGILNDTTYKITVQDLANSLTQVSSSISASYSTTSSYAVSSSQATSASYALSASNANSSSYSLSSSYSTTSSYALNGGVTSIIAGASINVDTSTGNVTVSYAGGGGAFPFTGSAQITASNGNSVGLGVTGSISLLDGSLLGTSSWAYNLVGGTQVFPYTGSAVISGSLEVTGSVKATQGGLTGSLFGTASYVTGSLFSSTNPALSSSYALSASFSSTASYVNALVQNVLVTGSLVVSGSNGAGVFSQGATLVDYVTGISSTGSYMVWRAPFSCSVVALYGYYIGGTAPQINAARSGSSGYGKITGSNALINRENVWVAATGSGLQNVNFNEGDSLQVIMSGSTNNQLAVQVDFIRKF